jgi:hypothetical protein
MFTRRVKILRAQDTAAVVSDAEAYRCLFDIAARADVEEGIRQGPDDARKGKTRPAREFFEEFEATHSDLE